ncbi:cellulose biosynthesis protein BcsQ [Photobacterium sp. R1]
MKRVAIVSLRGGAGSNTVTAHLAQSLVQVQKDVLAVDTDPVNVLRLNLGMPFSHTDGWASRICDSGDWFASGFESPHGVAFLPFGQLSQPFLSRFTAQRALYLSELVTALSRVKRDDEREHWQLYHLVVSDLQWLNTLNASEQFDLVLVVLTPDAASYAVLQHNMPQFEGSAGPENQTTLKFVLNQFQPETELSRDFMLVMKNELGPLLSPVVLHRDIALMDSAANLTTVQHYSPGSQAARDYQTLALWCIAQLSSH